jgi:hypothetical protein
LLIFFSSAFTSAYPTVPAEMGSPDTKCSITDVFSSSLGAHSSRIRSMYTSSHSKCPYFGRSWNCRYEPRIPNWIKIPNSNKKQQTGAQLELGKLRSHLPWLWFTLTLHKFPAEVPILIGGWDQPLQGHRTGAIRAPRHRHRTIPRPVAGGCTRARHLSPVLPRLVAGEEEERGSEDGTSSGEWLGQDDGSGSYFLSRCDLDKLWDPWSDVEMRWDPCS